jgi:hypothetical protein
VGHSSEQVAISVICIHSVSLPATHVRNATDPYLGAILFYVDTAHAPQDFSLAHDVFGAMLRLSSDPSVLGATVSSL